MCTLQKGRATGELSWLDGKALPLRPSRGEEGRRRISLSPLLSYKATKVERGEEKESSYGGAL